MDFSLGNRSELIIKLKGFAFPSGFALSKDEESKRIKTRKTRNLVDPASSHMLVSRIKPCKSQSKWIKLDLRTAH